jgi:hypothetical protein
LCPRYEGVHSIADRRLELRPGELRVRVLIVGKDSLDAVELRNRRGDLRARDGAAVQRLERAEGRREPVSVVEVLTVVAEHQLERGVRLGRLSQIAEEVRGHLRLRRGSSHDILDFGRRARQLS